MVVYKIHNLIRKGHQALKKAREQMRTLREQREEALHPEEKYLLQAPVKEASIKIDISTQSVAKAALAILAIIAGVFFLIRIQQILIIFFFATFLAISFNPLVNRLQKKLIPRWFSIFLIYITILVVCGLLISSLVPILRDEIPALARSIIHIINNIFPSINLDTASVENQITEIQNYLNTIDISKIQTADIKSLISVAGGTWSNALNIISSVAGGIFTFVIVLVITFFILVNEEGIKNFLKNILPIKYHLYAVHKAELVEEKFGAWIHGEFLLMLVIGLLTFIGLKILGVKYAVTLGIFAGFMEIIPYIGPFLALIPAALIAFNQFPVLALWIIGLYVLIQQIENNIVVPLVMKKAVGLNPLIIMFAMMVGVQFPDLIHPIIGLILAVPIATAIAVFLQDYTEDKKSRKKSFFRRM